MKAKAYSSNSALSYREALARSLAGVLLSKWTSLRWTFAHQRNVGETTRLAQWSFIVKDGVSSEAYPELIEQFKILLASLLANRYQQSSGFNSRSVGGFMVGARGLFRWMVANGIRDFSQLSLAVCKKYLADLPFELLHPTVYRTNHCSKRNTAAQLIKAANSEFAGVLYRDEWDEQGEENLDGFEIGEDGYDANDTNGGVKAAATALATKAASQPSKEGDDAKPSYSQVYLRASTLQQIYLQRTDFEEYGIPHMVEHPYDGASIKEVIDPISKVVREITPPLPDEVAIPILTEALSWLDYKTADVLKLRNIVLNCRKRHKGVVARHKFYKKLNYNLSKFRFSILPGAEKPWHDQLIEQKMEAVTHRADTVIEVTRTPIRLVRHLLLSTRDAAFTLLNYLVGLRISEYRSIRVLKGSQLLHGCIEKKLSKGGELEMYFLHGSITKGQETPLATEWLIGCRPVGAEWEPITVRAVGLVKELFSPWKAHAADYGLFQQFLTANGLPEEDALVADVFEENLPLGLRRFIHHYVDLSGLPMQSARGESLAGYIATQGRCITTHQGRKTFCAYMLDSRRSLLVPVSRHFHHINTALTEASYYSVLTRMRRELDSEATANTVRVFEDVMDGNSVLAGKMADQIDEMCRSEGWAELRNRRERHEAVKSAVELHELRIYFSRYGMCFIKAKPQESRCRESAGKTGWLWDEPAFEYRTPSLCSGCGCFAIDPSHLSYWEERAKRPLRKSTKEFYVLNAQREQAVKVVSWLRSAVT